MAHQPAVVVDHGGIVGVLVGVDSTNYRDIVDQGSWCTPRTWKNYSEGLQRGTIVYVKPESRPELGAMGVPCR